MIRVVKSVRGSKVCYSFLPQRDDVWDSYDVTDSLMYPGVIYSVVFRSLIIKSHRLSVIYYYSSESDGIEVPFNSLRERFEFSIKDNSSYLLRVSGDTETVNKLPPDLDTNCLPGGHPRKCYEDSVSKCILGIGVHYSSAFITDETSNLSVITKDEFTHHAEFVGNCQARGKQECLLRPACKSTESFTSVEHLRLVDPNVDSELWFMASQGKDKETTHRESFPLSEYMILIASLFSLCFGVSINQVPACFGASWIDVFKWCRCVDQDEVGRRWR